jgi:hypothetical protein
LRSAGKVGKILGYIWRKGGWIIPTFLPDITQNSTHLSSRYNPEFYPPFLQI